MKKLYQALCTFCSIIGCILQAARNYCIENPVFLSGTKKLLVTLGIVITIVSAMLWHVSALMQEQVALAENLDPVKILAVTKASAMLNTKAAMLGMIAAVLNGVFFWLGTLKTSEKE